VQHSAINAAFSTVRRSKSVSACVSNTAYSRNEITFRLRPAARFRPDQFGNGDAGTGKNTLDNLF
jgi:hypothetical protein